MKFQLNNVTLIAPTGDNIENTILSLNRCCQMIDFADVKLITHEKPKNLPNFIKWEESSYPMDTYQKYNRYVFLDLGKHIETSHCLLVQYDSWIIHPELWNDAWLMYDYIGAPWPIRENSYIGDNGERVRVGNGGFSLRSKKLQDAPRLLGLEHKEEQGYWNEDGNFCCYSRKELLEYGIKYAPIEIASIFSYENEVEENQSVVETFGFHKNIRKHEYERLKKIFK